MALEPVKLDDLTWSDMVLGIRRRIAAVSDGKWTLHAPVDPGVTLLELFAWLLEQRGYWMDQTPDALVRGTLSLLGEAPKPTQASTTVMNFGTPNNALVVPRRTQLRLLRSTTPIIFSTEEEVALLPFDEADSHPQGLSLFVNGRDRTTDLSQGKVLRLFPADDSPAEVKIVLRVRGSLPPELTGKKISLLFDLRNVSNVPEWSPDATKKVPPPVKISWWYSGAGGQLLQFKDSEIVDGTCGLRRSGLVRLPIKEDWRPEALKALQCRYAIRMRVERATFTAPPRVERLIPNVVTAVHRRRTENHRLRRDWRPLPGNVIELADLPENNPEKDHPPIENTVWLKIKERCDGRWHRWRLTHDLTFHGPKDRVFLVDRQRGEVRFGNGLTGRLPVLAKNDNTESQLSVQYFVGGGTAGHLGENRQWEATVENQNVHATNVVQTEGGAEPETTGAARERMALLLKKRTRAVTNKDYEEIARTTAGVAIKRAHAAIGFHPQHPCVLVPGAVTVFVVPAAPRETPNEVAELRVENAFVAAPIPDPGALAAIRAQLNESRLVTSEVFVRAPRYRPVALTVTVENDPADPSRIRERIKEQLQNFLDPLVGGDKREGWPFGEPLRPSVLLREAQRALGEAGDVISVSVKLLDTKDEAKDCSDVRIGEHELVTLHEVKVQLRRSAANRPEQGGLR